MRTIDRLAEIQQEAEKAQHTLASLIISHPHFSGMQNAGIAMIDKLLALFVEKEQENEKLRDQLQSSARALDRRDAYEARKERALAAEVAVLRESLQKIKDEEGHVCENFELCYHPACKSSYTAWAIADEVLTRKVQSA